VYEAGGAEGGLYMSRLSREEAEQIPGTEGGFFPFFSPDGDWIAFARPPGAIVRVPAAGGDVEMIVPALPDLDVSVTGLTWGDDGMLYGAGTDGTLVGVPGTGGEIDILRSGHDGGFPRYGPPHILPGSDALLLHRQHSWDPENSDVVVVDLATGDETVVLENGMDARYIDTGYLLFFRQGTLMAVDFDLRTRQVEGQPVALLDDVMHAVRMPNTNVEIGAAQLAVSAAGHIAYVRGGVYPERIRTAVRVTSAGDTTELEIEPAEIGRLRVSPDGIRVAFQAGPGVADRIFIHDLVRGQTRALATGGYTNSSPTWSPDGMSIAFTSDRDQANANLYRMAVDGATEPQRIAPSERSQSMTSWSSTGVIAFLEGGDIWVVPPDGEPRAFFESEGDERWATFSPDGAWLAYVSSDNGVYVRPYPGPEPPTLIADRGSEPAWSPDGRQIYYRGDEGLYAVDVTPGADFRAGRPRVLIEPWPSGSVPVRLYDVFPDGSFLTVGPNEDTVESVSELQVVLNFFDVLEERMGRGR
jgi:Tol biopolymer transport system component